MSFNFSDGFLFAVGWFVAKVTRGGIQTTTTKKDRARLQGLFPFEKKYTDDYQRRENNMALYEETQHYIKEATQWN